MKKIIVLILAAALMCATFTGCSGSDKNTGDTGSTAASGKTLADIKAAGKLVIATSPDFPPFEELQSDGSVVGIEIDILNMICKELGVELEIQQMDFESVLPGVQAGKFDLGVSGITANDE
ncbi:MAG: transporter substrate-binding domain-containing protein, partial [Lachnospiraceae bacterium]|nr:transporter substrate-binding domain-containing protein [Lachnospiraceae bacterium]